MGSFLFRLIVSPLMLVAGCLIASIMAVLWVLTGEKWVIHLPAETMEKEA